MVVRTSSDKMFAMIYFIVVISPNQACKHSNLCAEEDTSNGPRQDNAPAKPYNTCPIRVPALRETYMEHQTNFAILFTRSFMCDCDVEVAIYAGRPTKIRSPVVLGYMDPE